MTVKKTANGYSVTETGEATFVQYFDFDWHFIRASVTTVNGAAITTQNFDSSWGFVGASSVVTEGNATKTQNFDSSWHFTGATTSTASDGATTIQNFDAGWHFTGATVTRLDGGATSTQSFDASWQFTGATTSTSSGGATTVQTFDSGWHFTGATVTRLDGGATSTQSFDASWQFTGATTSTSSGGATTVQTFDSSWHFTGATVMRLDGGATSVQNFNSSWHFIGAEVTRVEGATTSTQRFDENWHFTGATASHVEGGRYFVLTFDQNWQFEGATIDTKGISGAPYAATRETFDSNWSLRSWTAYDAAGHIVDSHEVNHAPSVGGVTSGAVTEDIDAGSGFLHASGVLTISDPDAGQSSFMSESNKESVNKYGTFSVTADGAWEYHADNSQSVIQQLGQGQSLTDSFIVVSKDGYVSTTVAVTINGTDDAAVISGIATAGVTEDAGVGSDGFVHTSGSLTVTDLDAGQSSFATNVGSIATNLGHLTISETGVFEYAVANSAIQFLGAHATKTDTFTVYSADGTSKQISIDVHGAQDKPVLELLNTTGKADGAIELKISVSAIDVGSVLGDVEIEGIPSYYKLDHGYQNGDGGSWFVPVDKLPGLSLVASGTVIPGDFSLKVKATSIDGDLIAASNGVINVSVAAGQVPVATGRLIDGYIAGATVFADANENGRLDAGEVSATTGIDGSFSLVGGTGSLVSIGGTDISTGLLFSGVLKAPAGSTVITPLTTLVVAIVAANGGTFQAASNQVAAAFGFDPGVNLAHFDPVPTATDNDPTAKAILSAAIQVQSTVAQIVAVGGAADQLSAANQVFNALATVVSNPGTEPFNLKTASTVEAVVAGAGVTGAAATVVASTVAAANLTIQSAADVTQLAQAGQVAQGAASDKLADLATAISKGSPDVATISDQINTTYVVNIVDQVIAAQVSSPAQVQAGTSGNDVLYGTAGIDTIDGRDGNDQIFGYEGNDLLFGGAGRDILVGGAGDDLLDGGAGFDRAAYTDATGGITANLGAGTVSGSGVGTDTLVRIEGIIGSDFADTFDATGFAGSSDIPGTPVGFNEFEGRGGNDTIIGRVNDQGAALTRVSYLSATSGVTVDLAAKTADGDASVGHDTFVGNGVGFVFGSAFNDTLLGSNNGFNTVEAFEGRAGNDTINGRGGFDRADYNNDTTTTSGITVNLAAGIVTGDATVGTDTLISVEAVRGTAFADTYNAVDFSGTSTNAGSNGTFNEFTGGGGNDMIIGNGNTRITYSTATAGVMVNMQTGAVAGTGTAIGDASVGTDSFSGVNAVMATLFDDNLTGSSNNDTFIGLAGNDFIDGRGGFDTASYANIYLTTGGVTVNLAAGTATGDASIGSDTLRSIEGIQGTNFADKFNALGFTTTSVNAGSAGSNASGAAFNFFEGLGGDDLIIGNGNTRIGFGNATGGVTVNLDTGIATGDVSVGTDTFSGVNAVNGSAFADTLIGSAANEFFDGGAGSDTISAGGGSDTITGGAGNDIIDGGTGADMAVFSGTRNQYTINFSTPVVGQTQVIDNVANRDGADALTSVELLQFSDAFLLAATGTSANSLNVSGLTFGANTNTVFGTSFDDYLTIGQTLYGHQINLGAGANDTVNLNAAGGFFSLNLANVEYVNGSSTDDSALLVNNASGLVIDLGGGNDTLSLANGMNTIAVSNVESITGSDFGGTSPSNDTLTLLNTQNGVSINLGDGVNTLNLATGANTLGSVYNMAAINGSSADDTLTLQNGIGNVTIDLGGGNDTLNLQGQFNSVTVRNVENVVAGASYDSITIANTSGMTTVTAGIGSDSITASASSDVIRYTSAADSSFAGGVDTIGGFDAANDKFLFDGMYGGLAGFTGQVHFIGSGGFSGTSTNRHSEARLDVFGGQATLQIDVDGDGQMGANDMAIQLNGLTGTLTDANFQVVVPINHAPTDIVVSGLSVAENSANGTIIGALSSTDQDAGDTASYSLVDDAGGRFAISNGNLVVAGALDFELATSHQVVIRVTDAGGSIFDKTFTIAVIDLPDGTTINGDTNDNTLIGTSGNDTIHGFAGNDRLQGLGGDDTLDGGDGVDRAIYTDATAGLTFNLASGVVNGSAAGVGTDTLVNIEAIVGTEYADTFDATGFAGVSGVPGTQAGFNEFEGRGGNDIIIGGYNASGAPLTRISYANATAAVVVDLQAGTAVGNASVGTDTISGGVGVVVGSGFADTLRGSNNPFGSVEAFDGRGGNDIIDGRGGFDRVEYGLDPAITSGITVNLAAGTVTGDAAVGTDTLISIESVRGTVFADTYNAVGFSGTSTNAGSNGTFNEFNGGAGNDIIIGNGATRISYNNATGAVSVDLQTGAVAGTGTASGDASTGTDTFSGVNAVMGSVFSDTVYGSSNNDTFMGLAGDDYLDGRGGYDTATYYNMYYTTGGVTVNLAAGTTTGDASIGTDTLRSIEGIQGTLFADTFNAVGFTATSVNAGSSGVNGAGAAFNQFEGLGGNDTVIGNGNTRIAFFNATAGVTVNLGTGTATGDASVGTDTFSGVNGVAGSAFADNLVGTGANEYFDGGAGDDQISAGGGNDTMIGGAGNDTIDAGSGTDMAVFSGARNQYTINLNTPTAGQMQIIDNVSNRDGTDVLTGVEVLQFSNMYQLMATGSLATPLNIAAFNLSGNTNTLFGTGNNDYLTVGQNVFGHLIDLGAGAADTVNLAGAGNYNISLANVEILNGSSGNDFVSMGNSVNGLVIDLGSGVDTLVLAGGTSTVNMQNVETLQTSDFGVGVNVNDVVTLVNNVNGLSVNLANGNNILNLAAGANTLSNAFGENTINGSISNDTLTFTNGAYHQMINLGDGDDTVAFGNTNQSATVGILNVEHLTSGSGDDYIFLMNNVNGLSVDLGGGNDTLAVAAGASTLSLQNVEALNASDFGPGVSSDDVITLTNNVSGLTVNLGNGNNILNLAAGVNMLANVYGAITIHGSSTSDTLILANGGYQQNVDLGDGDDTVSVNDAPYSTLGLSHVEHLTGGAADNFVTMMNAVNGLPVDLGGGNDTLMLADGVNSIALSNVESVQTADYLPGVSSDDTLSLLSNVNGLNVNLFNGTNTLNLAAGANSFSTIEHASFINGSTSADTLTFQNNVYDSNIDLGGSADTVIFNGIAGNVTVTNVETVIGSAMSDGITIGNTSGATTVTGGLGSDYIVASAAEDNFRFTSAADSSAIGPQDQIVGFNAAMDHFVFNGMSGGANGFTGAISFVGEGGFTGSIGALHSEARLDISGGQTTLQIDVDGDGAMGANDMAIHLVNHIGTLSNSNFLLT